MYSDWSLLYVQLIPCIFFISFVYCKSGHKDTQTIEGPKRHKKDKKHVNVKSETSNENESAYYRVFGNTPLDASPIKAPIISNDAKKKKGITQSKTSTEEGKPAPLGNPKSKITVITAEPLEVQPNAKHRMKLSEQDRKKTVNYLAKMKSRKSKKSNVVPTGIDATPVQTLSEDEASADKPMPPKSLAKSDVKSAINAPPLVSAVESQNTHDSNYKKSVEMFV